MGLKEIFKDGMQELKRKSALSKEKKNLSQKEKLLSEQLTSLGKKAWDSKLDIGCFGNARELIENTQGQIDTLNNLQAGLEKQKLDLENKKKQENETFNSQRQEVENKKKDVDARLNSEKKILRDAQRDSDNAWNRLKQIAKEDEVLITQLNAPGTTDEQKTAIQGKVDALKKEKEDLEKKQAIDAETGKATEQKIKPLEEESAAYQKEIDRVKGEQRNVIGQLDESLSKTNKEISDNKNKLAELTKEQNKHFCQLGEKLAAIQTADAAVAPELNAVNSTKKEIESIQVGIQSLEYQGTDDSKNAFSKMIWLIILFVIVLIVIIAAIVIAFGPKKQGPLSLDEIRNPGQNKEISSPEDALKEVTGLFKKQLNKGENKAVTVSDKDTLAAALPTGSWKPEKTSYHKAKLGELEYSILDTTYAGPDGQSINVQVTDSADVSSLLSGIQMILLTNLSHEDENGYEKISEYDNMKVIEKYSKNPPFASFGFIVKDRYIVNIKCDHENGIGILKQFIAGFDFSKLP